MQKKTYGLSRLKLREGGRGGGGSSKSSGGGTSPSTEGQAWIRREGARRGFLPCFQAGCFGVRFLEEGIPERSPPYLHPQVRVRPPRLSFRPCRSLPSPSLRPGLPIFPFRRRTIFPPQQVHPPVVLGQKVLAWYRSTRPIPVEVHLAELIPSPCPTPLALVMAGNKPSFLKIVMKTSVPRVMNPGDFSFLCGSACTAQRKKTGQNERLYETGHDFIIEKTLGKWQVFRKTSDPSAPVGRLGSLGKKLEAGKKHDEPPGSFSILAAGNPTKEKPARRQWLLCPCARQRNRRQRRPRIPIGAVS